MKLVDNMSIRDAIELVARFLDTSIDKQLAELAAGGADEAGVAHERAQLAAWRAGILGELWARFERDEIDGR